MIDQRDISTEGTPKVRVLVVDDHPIVRHGVRHALATRGGFEIVGEAGSLGEALGLCALHAPQVVVLDLVLGGRDGPDGVAEMRRAAPAARILVFSMNPEEIFAPLVLRTGANGYLMKTDGFEAMHHAFDCILAGGTYLSPKMKSDPRAEAASEFSQLSDREMQVFLRLGEGKTTSEIAHELNLNVKTVFSHRDNLKAKLRLTSGAELARRAMAHVLGQGSYPPAP